MEVGPVSDFMAAPCVHCPFKQDVKPFLHPERAYDIANTVHNPYNDPFPCHKTTESDDDSEEGEMMVVETTKVCAGWLTMMACSRGSTPYDDDGFEPSAGCYEDPEDMFYAYEEEWEKHKK
jgi:hypothetical protein